MTSPRGLMVVTIRGILPLNDDAGPSLDTEGRVVVVVVVVVMVVVVVVVVVVVMVTRSTVLTLGMGG